MSSVFLALQDIAGASCSPVVIHWIIAAAIMTAAAISYVMSTSAVRNPGIRASTPLSAASAIIRIRTHTACRTLLEAKAFACENKAKVGCNVRLKRMPC